MLLETSGMKSESEFIAPDRLMAAVDALYLAQEELGDFGLPRYPPDLMGQPHQPAAFTDFTRHEIEEATFFLARLGLIQGIAQRRDDREGAS